MATPPRETLPGRNLDENELKALVTSFAEQPAQWEDEIAFDDEHRHYACLHRDEHVDVWVLCWTPRNDTGWHDHDLSSGAVAVVRGELLECNLRVGAPSVERVIASGDTFSFGSSYIHRLTGRTRDDAGGAGDTSPRRPASPPQHSEAVSIHAYSPPLTRLGQYDVDADGVLRRMSVSYTDELRPLAAV